MPTLHKDFQLDKLNTFGVSALAKYFIRATTLSEITECIKSIIPKDSPLLILGGGSNILFTKDFDGVILQPMLTGIEEIYSDKNSITLSVGAGEAWDSLVEYTVSRGLGGLENLSLIPGTVGASPIQNIGAYGVEVKDCIEMVVALNLETMEIVKFSNSDCKFEYRNSIFKKELKGKVIITHVLYKLSKNPKLITHYGNLDAEISALGDRTIENVRKAVINIRNTKLPDPKLLGNAGSFFKNPVVSVNTIERIKEIHETVPYYPADEDSVKLPAGWLIEKCGWKGKRIGNVGVHQNQALVLVNYGGAKGIDLLNLANEIVDSVKQNFNICLEMEVNVV